MVNPRRIRQLNISTYQKGTIIYWMSREQRAQDNWALLYAQELAQLHDAELYVVFCLRKEFSHATERMIHFMFEGLKETASELSRYGIPFFFLLGDPKEELPLFIKEHAVGAVVTEFTPHRRHRFWKDAISKHATPFFEVDSRNIVPCWVASEKREVGAYTFRPKIHKLLPEFLVEFPTLRKHTNQKTNTVDFNRIYKMIMIDTTVNKTSILPGSIAAVKTLNTFLTERLDRYAEKRNDPTENGQSGLSPYLHFGHISSQRIALETMKHPPSPDRDAFLEELIVRRELSDNFCFFTPEYKTTECFPEWAKKSLDKHLQDKRHYQYSLNEFERAQTHDPLWNAAQNEMVYTGKMHGYIRMYWAKKILEWTKTPQDALDTAIFLNDKYELDGRDSNGYTGIAWAIGGVHDRPWFERSVFGQIRYMNMNGAARKFDVKKYITNSETLVGK